MEAGVCRGGLFWFRSWRFWAKCGDRRVAGAAAWANGFRCVISVSCGMTALAADQDSARKNAAISINTGWVSMATDRSEPMPCWQVRRKLVAWTMEAKPARAERAEAERALAEAIERGVPVPGRPGFVYSAFAVFRPVKEITVWSNIVEIFRPGCESIRFRVNRSKSGHITFTDTRDGKTGIAGTTGIWGTRPAMRPSRPRSITPSAFKIEAARFVGMERAEEILREIINARCRSRERFLGS